MLGSRLMSTSRLTTTFFVLRILLLGKYRYREGDRQGGRDGNYIVIVLIHDSNESEHG